MNKKINKQRFGLIGLYTLLVISAILLHQIYYYGFYAFGLMCLTIIVLTYLWTYLLNRKIITITWRSMTYEDTKSKSERIFLFSLVGLVAPILRFHNITSYDILVSIIVVIVGVSGFIINENYLVKKKERKKKK